MAAAAQCGTTVLYNAAKEPEIESLCAYLEKCGAVITGAGTECVRVRGKGVLLFSGTAMGLDDPYLLPGLLFPVFFEQGIVGLI